MKISLPFPHSIRWRLPVSYAAIALIAALALGVVLLTTLRSYYAQVEWEYLHNNALAVRTVIDDMETHGASPEIIETQLQNFSFLAQVRIQRLDHNRTLILDTGTPDSSFVSVARDPGVHIIAGWPPRDPELALTGTPSPQPDTTTTSQITRADAAEPTWVPDRTYTFRMFKEALQQNEAGDTAPSPNEPPPFVFAFPARRTLFGFNLNDANPDYAQRRSSQSIEITLDGDDAGYVKLSDGPAYGLEIVDGVARAWLVSSAIAVMLAALIGLFISRRISAPLLALTHITSLMSDGNLTARSTIRGEDEVGVLARSFNEMANRVEETITTLRRFVADAAHELHTPLTALRTNLELLNDDGADGSQRQFVGYALAQVDRLEALTSDLLELSRLEAGNEYAGLTPVNLCALIRQISELYASQAEQANIDFNIDLTPEDVVLPARESQIRRALGNLLENAIKFTPSGGVIQVTLCSESDGAIEIQVQDTGIGIPDSDLPQLFNRFHRGRNASAYPGSGLGLAIVKAIVDAHGGSVSAQQRHPGTQFTIRLSALHSTQDAVPNRS